MHLAKLPCSFFLGGGGSWVGEGGGSRGKIAFLDSRLDERPFLKHHFHFVPTARWRIVGQEKCCPACLGDNHVELFQFVAGGGMLPDFCFVIYLSNL